MIYYDKIKALNISDQLPELMVIHGDGRSVDLLEEDKPISGQKFVCVSFVCPDEILIANRLTTYTYCLGHIVILYCLHLLRFYGILWCHLRTNILWLSMSTTSGKSLI